MLVEYPRENLWVAANRFPTEKLFNSVKLRSNENAKTCLYEMK